MSIKKNLILFSIMGTLSISLLSCGNTKTPSTTPTIQQTTTTEEKTDKKVIDKNVISNYFGTEDETVEEVAVTGDYVYVKADISKATPVFSIQDLAVQRYQNVFEGLQRDGYKFETLAINFKNIGKIELNLKSALKSDISNIKYYSMDYLSTQIH